VAKSNRDRQSAREKIAQQRAAQARRKRRRLWLACAGAAVIVIAAAVGITLAVTGGSPKTAAPKLAPLSALGSLGPAPSPGALGSEGVPVPAGPALADTVSAGTGTAATGQPVNGISCQAGEQTLFHIHAHLTIFVNGSARQVPAGIGIPGAQVQSTPNGPFIESGTCFYWLHTHAPDGIIHIESPVQRTFTLGDFFDIWGQPLGPDRVGPATGPVTALYNGQVYQGNPRDIPLNAHAQIQLQVGKPLIAPEQITFPSGL
jgi:hypothetical protein